jgi:hypothetical protein
MKPSLSLVLALVAVGSAAAADPGKQTWRLNVAETAGIRRFAYPVTAYVPLNSPVKDADHFRLLYQGKTVPAQFRPHGDTRQGISKVVVDFTADLDPLDSRDYAVEYDPAAEANAEPKDGLKVETADDEFRVSHPDGPQFVVPRNLLGLLRQVKTAKTEYLHPGSAGLMIRYKDEIPFRAGGFGPDGVPTTSRVTREGPLAVALRFEGTEALRGNRSVASAVEMEFPRSKSWVKVTWEVNDPNGWVAGLGADLNLNVPDGPTLIDLGASTLVYAKLGKDQTAVLRALPKPPVFFAENGPPSFRFWETLLGPTGDTRPYVLGPEQVNPVPPEGWVHLMDRQRCTAAAIRHFGQEPVPVGALELPVGGEIRAEADGQLRLRQDFGRGGGTLSRPGKKAVTFWLHFIPMPVQEGAVTSPQAMLAPLQVTVSPR